MKNINVDMIVQSGSATDEKGYFAFTINKADEKKAENIMNNLKDKIKFDSYYTLIIKFVKYLLWD